MDLFNETYLTKITFRTPRRAEADRAYFNYKHCNVSIYIPYREPVQQHLVLTVRTLNYLVWFNSCVCFTYFQHLAVFICFISICFLGILNLQLSIVVGILAICLLKFVVLDCCWYLILCLSSICCCRLSFVTYHVLVSYPYFFYHFYDYLTLFIIY